MSPKSLNQIRVTCPPKQQNPCAKRRGTILPLIAISLLALMGIAALAVDIGALALAKAQFQMAADAAAFAGARYLDDNTKDDFSKATTTANAAGLSAISKHKILNSTIKIGRAHV